MKNNIIHNMISNCIHDCGVFKIDDTTYRKTKLGLEVSKKVNGKIKKEIWK